MTSVYTKNRESDFGGNWDIEQLKDEIISQISKYEDCIVTGNDLTIKFSEALTEPEETNLNSIVSSHSPLYAPKRRGSNHIEPTVKETMLPVYNFVGLYKYGGLVKEGPINFIDIVAKADSDITSFDIKAVDGDTMDTVASATGLTGSTYTKHSLGNITNLSRTNQTLYFIAKKNGGSEESVVHIDDIIFN